MSDATRGSTVDTFGTAQTVRADDGVDIAFRVHGAGRRPVTLLHSLGLDGSWFESLVTAMGSDYQFIVPDLRGHGRSATGEVSLGRVAADVITVLDACDARSSAVFGISMGGMVAQVLAASYPERVDALCLAATTYGYDEPAIAGALARAAEARNGMAPIAAATVARWFGPADEVPQRLLPQARRAEQQLLAGSATVHADYLAAMTQVGEFAVPVGTPTLVLGGRDDLSTGSAVIERLAGSIPGAELHFVPGGHLMAFTDPESVAAHLRDFLDCLD
ncbi:alpha/beta fold hydrolase [Flexivirga alba]|uniref:Alpha/beta fold hydrolase n=1 Tax=Flexivirga alba TaxID=702742 RepID=A0ABW2AK20_9MICO